MKRISLYSSSRARAAVKVLPESSQAKKKKSRLRAWLRRHRLALFAAAQTQPIITLPSEPHHHLALSNQYVRLYQVRVSPHDSVLLHRHEYEAISIMNGDAEVTVHSPGRPDAPQKLSNGQVRLQPAGYIHSTEIGGDQMYRNVTVELLRPQGKEQNLCAAVMAGGSIVQNTLCSRTRRAINWLYCDP